MQDEELKSAGMGSQGLKLKGDNGTFREATNTEDMRRDSIDKALDVRS